MRNLIESKLDERADVEIELSYLTEITLRLEYELNNVINKIN